MSVNHTIVPKAFSPRHQAVYAQQRKGQVPAAIQAIMWSSFNSQGLHMASPDKPQERALIDMVIDVCETKHISPVPPIYIAQTGILNAASISGQGLVYTTGILKAMNKEQLAAVTGHELSHHRHSLRDTALLAVLGVAGWAVANVAFDLLTKTALSSRSGAMQNAGMALDVLTASRIPAYLGTMAAITPWRHYMELEADYEGAHATQPEHMKSALERLMEESHKPKTQVNERSLLNRVVRAVLNPFPSHPSTDERIARIEAMGQGRSI